MPKGMVFDFKMPSEQNEQYKKLVNVNQGGTFALGDNGGMGEAQGLQQKYLSDKFARDTSQNYQDNISNASSGIKNELAQAAGAKGQTDQAVISALSGFNNTLVNAPKKIPWWQSLLGGIASGVKFSSGPDGSSFSI